MSVSNPVVGQPTPTTVPAYVGNGPLQPIINLGGTLTAQDPFSLYNMIPKATDPKNDFNNLTIVNYPAEVKLGWPFRLKVAAGCPFFGNSYMTLAYLLNYSYSGSGTEPPRSLGSFTGGVTVAPAFGVITSVTGGQVTSIINASGGGGYTSGSPPRVTISGGGGTGATAHAVLNNIGSSANWFVDHYVVDTPGSGYTSPPQVEVAWPPGIPYIQPGLSPQTFNFVFNDCTIRVKVDYAAAEATGANLVFTGTLTADHWGLWAQVNPGDAYPDSYFGPDPVQKLCAGGVNVFIPQDSPVSQFYDHSLHLDGLDEQARNAEATLLLSLSLFRRIPPV